MSSKIMLPTAPLAMQLAVALPALAPENRLDMQIATGFDAGRLPQISFGGGPLAQIAMTLSMISGSFTLDNIPQLEMQMQQAADSLHTNVWPRLGWLAQIKIQPLLNYALIARLVLNLRSLGIDVFSVTSFPPSPVFHKFRFALTPPRIAMARLLAGLPQVLALSETLDIPPLGDTSAFPPLQNRLNALAALTPPKLLIPMPLLTKLALVLESLAVINEAFSDAFSPMTLDRIRSMLRLWSGFQIPIPFPMEALALNAKLDALPQLDNIALGEQAAGSFSTAFASAHFSPPKLAIAPFLNLVLALRGSLQIAIDMEPFDMCSMCPCS